ncbi:MAG: BREX system Lon protease-like protein BrxL [Candidatus Heimdallarchaeota archaeon]|nr:BREX system Lon protease-like protein BrxL [Candidatus Heimdallarchaeota archaeon]
MVEENKVVTSFEGDIIDKSLILSLGIKDIPRHVTERIFAKILSREQNVELAKIKTKKFIDDHRPAGDASESLKHELLTNSSVVLLDRFEVQVNIKNSEYKVPIPSMGISAIISEEIVDYYPALVNGGVWGLSRLGLKGVKNEKFVKVDNFEPFQVADFNIDEFASRRLNFTTDEWIDLLITSIGYDPNQYPHFTQKLLLLTRLIPFVQKNVNLMELGPKATGKTYIYRNLSFYSHVISGADTSPAQLFVNLSTGKQGLIPSYDVIAFDEITSSNIEKQHDTKLIGLLKDYMEGGSASRGEKQITAATSLVYLGNIKMGKNGRPVSNDYIMDLPKAYHDTALLDRLYGIIPGWEIPKIGLSSNYFAKEYGIINDYLAESLHAMRSMHSIDISNIEFMGNTSYRNENAVIKIYEALMKILFIGNDFSEDYSSKILNFACMLRNNLILQQHYLEPNEFLNQPISAKF